MSPENPYAPVALSTQPLPRLRTKVDWPIYFATIAVIMLVGAGWLMYLKSSNRLRFEQGFLFLIFVLITFANVSVWLVLKGIRYRYSRRIVKLK